MKLAEDIVARCSLTTLNNQILQPQSHHINPPLQHNIANLRRRAHVSPTITVHGNDVSYAAAMTAIGTQNSGIGPGNLGNSNSNNNSNFNTGVMSDAVSCVTDNMWAP